MVEGNLPKSAQIRPSLNARLTDAGPVHIIACVQSRHRLNLLSNPSQSWFLTIWGRGGIGRRAGLKNPLPYGSVGSIPTIPTIAFLFLLLAITYKTL
jgi:hypothetical protein